MRTPWRPRRPRPSGTGRGTGTAAFWTDQCPRSARQEFGTAFVDGRVVSVDFQQTPFAITVGAATATQGADGGEGGGDGAAEVVVRAHAVIVATGADSRWLGVQGEAQLQGKGVSSCATCDGFLFRGQVGAVACRGRRHTLRARTALAARRLRARTRQSRHARTRQSRHAAEHGRSRRPAALLRTRTAPCARTASTSARPPAALTPPANCALTCTDLRARFRGGAQDVVVVGGGDTAMEDALVLARTSKSVTVLHRRDAFRASHVLAKRVLAHKSIAVRWDTEVTAFEGAGGDGEDGGLTGVRVRDVGTGKASTLAAGAAFVAIGHDPNTALFRGTDGAERKGGALAVDEHGYLVTAGAGWSALGVAGVFAAGDVADKVYRQAVTSAGTGAAAALDAERWLSEQGLGAD